MSLFKGLAINLIYVLHALENVFLNNDNFVDNEQKKV